MGYLLVHPFAMLAYILSPEHQHKFMGFNLWGMQVSEAFSVAGLTMGGAFAFMGGIAGFCLGAWYLKKEESQRQLVTLETIRELMVTLAHYIRNSNMVIGGFSSHLAKHIQDQEIQVKLHMIQQASREIEAVITSLQSLTEISTVKYTTEGQARMIDLKKEMEARLAASTRTKKT